jgi:hypothetical protein
MTYAVFPLRALNWTFRGETYKREKPAAEIGPAYQLPPRLQDCKQAAIDAFDLCWNLRGCGWNWSASVHIPLETRPTKSTTAFMTATSTSFVAHYLMTDFLYYTIQWIVPSVTSPGGDSIFDSSLHLPHRYIKSTTITFLMLLLIYCCIHAVYLIPTAVGVLVFGQDPTLWPPPFDSPWLSTSLTQFWGRRWHQFFRDTIVSAGGYPLSLIAGRFGGLVGAFLMSGILHDIGLWGMSGHMEPQNVTAAFAIHGPLIMAENLWRRYTGSKVGGLIGWLWTLSWVVGTAAPLFDAWTRHGFMGGHLIPLALRPSILILGPPHEGVL